MSSSSSSEHGTPDPQSPAKRRLQAAINGIAAIEALIEENQVNLDLPLVNFKMSTLPLSVAIRERNMRIANLILTSQHLKVSTLDEGMREAIRTDQLAAVSILIQHYPPGSYPLGDNKFSAIHYMISTNQIQVPERIGDYFEQFFQLWRSPQFHDPNSQNFLKLWDAIYNDNLNELVRLLYLPQYQQDFEFDRICPMIVHMERWNVIRVFLGMGIGRNQIPTIAFFNQRFELLEKCIEFLEVTDAQQEHDGQNPVTVIAIVLYADCSRQQLAVDVMMNQMLARANDVVDRHRHCQRHPHCNVHRFLKKLELINAVLAANVGPRIVGADKFAQPLMTLDMQVYLAELAELEEKTISPMNGYRWSPTLWTFINLTPNAAARCTRNAILQREFQLAHENFQTVYPYFGFALNHQWRSGVERRRLLNDAVALIRTAGLQHLPDGVLEEIFEGFTNVQLEILEG